MNAGATAPSSSAFSIPSGTMYSWPTGAVEKDLYIKYRPAARQDAIWMYLAGFGDVRIPDE